MTDIFIFFDSFMTGMLLFLFPFFVYFLVIYMLDPNLDNKWVWSSDTATSHEIITEERGGGWGGGGGGGGGDFKCSLVSGAALMFYIRPWGQC